MRRETFLRRAGGCLPTGRHFLPSLFRVCLGVLALGTLARWSSFSTETETDLILIQQLNTLHSKDGVMCKAENENQIERSMMIRTPVHPNSNVDVERIEYYPAAQLIVVYIPSRSRCPRPYLIGRLSGPALVAIRWNTTKTIRTERTTMNIMIGTFDHAPLAGRYFLEVIQLFCHDFLPEQPWKSNAPDFSRTCVVDPEHNHVTSTTDPPVLDVCPPQHVSHDTVFPGHWIQQNASRQNLPVLTRYQPQQCRHDNATTAPRCAVHTSIDRFQGYEFGWREQQLSSAQLLQPTMTTAPFHLCLVGASHSYRLAQAFHSMGIVSPAASNNSRAAGFTVERIEALYPKDVVPALTNYPYHCDAAVIAVGQWSAGKPGGRPTLFRSYYKEMKRMFRDLAQRLSSHPSATRIYLRSINYNPLGDLLNTCPPKDWRSPAVMDGYNRILQHVCEEHYPYCQQFIDTSNFLVAPVWDSATDWCHLDPFVVKAQALYLAQQTTGLL